MSKATPLATVPGGIWARRSSCGGRGPTPPQALPAGVPSLIPCSGKQCKVACFLLWGPATATALAPGAVRPSALRSAPPLGTPSHTAGPPGKSPRLRAAGVVLSKSWLSGMDHRPQGRAPPRAMVVLWNRTTPRWPHRGNLFNSATLKVDLAFIRIITVSQKA